MATVKGREVSRKKLYMGTVLVILCAFAVFGISTVTDNDGPKSGIRRTQLITRTPISCIGFFEGVHPRAGIMLSWHDNTISINDDGKTEKLSGVVYPVTIPDTTLTYTSSNDEVAQIGSDGTIVAKMPGSVEISVKNDFTGEQSKAYLQVIQPVTGFYLHKSTINLYTTDMSVRLESEISPLNASNTAIQWYSKDQRIVKVDQTGHLTPVNTGMTEIVATTSDGGFTGKCFVNVINEVIRASSVTIHNKDNVKIKVGESWDGIVSVLPSNARNKTVQWVSENESVATVTKAGKVRAVGEGETVIKAKSADGPEDSVKIVVSGRLDTAVNNQVSTAYPSTAQSGVTYVKYSMTLDDMLDIQMNSDQPPKSSGSYIDRESAKPYLDPNQYCLGAYKYQFMDLSKFNGLSEQTLASFLDGKGTLSGQASAFIEAAREYGISELYLVAHACLESGYGTSALASGIEVNGVKVYNMFGIGAYDNSAVSSGSTRAYQYGWTSPEKAIKGGAKWISEHYINATAARQNTLYKMRWNPDNAGQHMYASDAGWATKQAVIMERLFKEFPDAKIAYEIPVYEGSNAAVIDDAAAMANSNETDISSN